MDKYYPSFLFLYILKYTMRQFKEYITERLVLNKHTASAFYPEQELRWNDTLMHFKNGAALFMFDAEMKGQISDGKYENAGPRGHYTWISKTVYCIDGEEYHSNFGHTKRYNLNEWVRNIKSILDTGEPKDNNYDFAIRLYDYGKLAHVLGDSIIYKLYQDKKLYALGNVVEILAETDRANGGYEDFVKTCKGRSWVVNYYHDVENYLTEDIFNKFVEYDYSFAEFKEDEKSMEATVNTYKADH